MSFSSALQDGKPDKPENAQRICASHDDTPTRPSGQNHRKIGGYCLSVLGGLLVIALCSSAFAGTFLALKYASTRGRFLAKPPEVLQLRGEPGRELRIIWDNGSSRPEDGQRLRLEFIDPREGLPLGLDVPVVTNWTFEPHAVLKIPENLNQEDVTVSGTLFGPLLLDNGETKSVEIPFQLRIAPVSEIGLPSKPLLSEPVAILVMIGSWILIFGVMYWLFSWTDSGTVGSDPS
jgi:hypothetical protein